MDQTPPSERIILDWLTDYTHFICNKFGISQDCANELLQQYLDLKARDPPQQATASPSVQQTNYPETPDPHQYTHHWEQPSTQLQNIPLGFRVHSDLLNESYDARETHHSSSPSTMAAPDPAIGPLFSSYDQQSGNMTMYSNPNPLETCDLPPNLMHTFSTNPLGSIPDYDPLWIQNRNLDPRILDNFSSNMQFDTLFMQGIIKINDVLTFQVSVTNNGAVQDTEAHLTIVSSSKSAADQRLPDLSVRVIADPSRQYDIAKACRSINDMVEHLGPRCGINVLSFRWRDIEVFRGQQALGSLWWMKQAFHLWRYGKDYEA